MARERVILHSDLNCFYASVEVLEHPQLQGKPVAVCGSTENRHGIVLAKSQEAKAKGVKTAEVNWQALEKCPELICIPPDFRKYLQYSQEVRALYRKFSPDIEPFGMDENWLDLGLLAGGMEEGEEIAQKIRQAVKQEIGLTVSIGVSFTKVFAKLGSDMKKPDAVTVIGRDDFREKVWPLPVGELLYVGPRTQRKLSKVGIHTIGDLARADIRWIHKRLGKNGLQLHRFANGKDLSRVMPYHYIAPIKSVGHGTTCVKDLDTSDEAWPVLLLLSQDIGRRLRDSALACGGVQLTVKDCDFVVQQYQMPLCYHSQSPLEIAKAAYQLLLNRHLWDKPVRALTVRAINLQSQELPGQLDFFEDDERHQKQSRLDKAVYQLQKKFGDTSILPASLMLDGNVATDGCDLVIMPGIMYA